MTVGGETDSFVNMRALVDFGPSFVFRRITIPAERLINSTMPVRPVRPEKR